MHMATNNNSDSVQENSYQPRHNVENVDKLYGLAQKHGTKLSKDEFHRGMDDAARAGRFVDFLIKKGSIRPEKRDYFLGKIYDGVELNAPASPLVMSDASERKREWLGIPAVQVPRADDAEKPSARQTMLEKQDAYYAADNEAERIRRGMNNDVVKVGRMDPDKQQEMLDQWAALQGKQEQETLQDIKDKAARKKADEEAADKYTAEVVEPARKEFRKALGQYYVETAADMYLMVRAAEERRNNAMRSKGISERYIPKKGILPYDEHREHTPEFQRRVRERSREMSEQDAEAILGSAGFYRQSYDNYRKGRRINDLDEDASAWSRFWSGVGTAFDGKDLATLGLSSMADVWKAKNALERVQAGEGSKADEDYLRSIYDKGLAEGVFEGGTAYNVGQAAWESMGFMLDMLATGGAGALARKGVKAGAKGVAKLLGREVAEQTGKKVAADTFGGAMKRAGLNFADQTIGAAVSPQVYKGAAERQVANYAQGYDENGRFTVKEYENPESLGKSILQSVLNNILERGSETLVGPLYEQGVRAISPVLARPLAAVAGDRNWYKNVRTFMDGTGNAVSKRVRDIRDRISVEGLTGEVFEEIVNEPLQRAFVAPTAQERYAMEQEGGSRWDGMYSREWWYETVLTCGAIQLAFATPQLLSNGVSTADNARLMNKYIRQLPEDMAQGLKKAALIEDETKRYQAVADLMRGATDQQQMSAAKYLIAREGRNLGVSYRMAEATNDGVEKIYATLRPLADADGRLLLVQDKQTGRQYISAAPGTLSDDSRIVRPVEVMADGMVVVGRPEQVSTSRLDVRGSRYADVDAYVEEFIKARGGADRAEAEAVRTQDELESRPAVRRSEPFVADGAFDCKDERGNTITIDPGDIIVPSVDVPDGAAPDTPVRIHLTKNGSNQSKPRVMLLGDLQDKIGSGDLTRRALTEEERQRVEADNGDLAGETETETEAVPAPVAEDESVAETETEAIESGTEPVKEIDTEEQTLTPIGQNRFGDIYQWGKGKVLEAVDFLRNAQSGYLKGVFSRPDIGEIDLAWGSEKGGLKHIILNHIVDYNDFDSVDEAVNVIEDVINNGTLTKQGTNLSLDYGKYRVSLAQSEEGTWVLTSFDRNRKKEEKRRGNPDTTIGDQSITDGENGALVSPESTPSQDKGTDVSEEKQVQLPENPVAEKWNVLVADNEGDEAEALDTATQMVGNKTAELEKARGEKATGKSEEAIQSAKRAKREKVSTLETELRFWQDVAAYPEKKRSMAEAARRQNERMERERKRKESGAVNPNYGLRQTETDDRLGAPLSLREYIIRKIATGRVKFRWGASESGTGGLKEHGGQAKRQMLYTDKTRGAYPEDVAEAMRLDIMDNYPEFGAVEASDILSEIENLAVGEQTPTEMMDEAVRLHERSARFADDADMAEAYQEEAAIEEAREEQARESVSDLTDEEYAAVHHAAPRFAGEMFDEEGRPKEGRPTEEGSVSEAEAQVDTNPTEAQKEAGNYRKGHVRISGLDITIENPKGSVRSGVDGDGRAWQSTMNNTYGYIRGTEGVDGDHIDVFLSDTPEAGDVFVIDQVNPKTGAFDEHKVMMGFDSEAAAREAYLSNYEEGWQGLGGITRVSREEFKKWLDSSHRKTKPFADYKGVDKKNHMLPKELSEAYRSGDKADIVNAENAIREFIRKGAKESPMATFATYQMSKDATRNKQNDEATIKTMSFIAEECKAAMIDNGYPKEMFYNQRARRDLAATTDRADVLYVMANDMDWNVKDAVVHNPHTSNETLKYFASTYKNSGTLGWDAEHILAERGVEDVRYRMASDAVAEEADVMDEIVSFSEKYGFDVADVQKYAESMRRGVSGVANYALANMRRKVRIDNTGKSLGEFVKIFAPIKAELYERFGDVDALNEENRQRAIEEMNMMEAARKRAEEEAQAERKRLEEFEAMSDEQLDDAYFKAIDDKDEARMRDLVNEAARRNGYVSLYEFKMAHRAPSYDEDGYDKSMVDVANNRDQIRESLNEQLRMNRDRSRDESAAAIEQALDAIERGENPTVTIYRAVPKSLKEGRIRNGDWVTLSENYAKNHGNHVLEGDYRIMKEVVPAENLYWDGNDINEWGYDDRSDYRYRDTKNNRKLNDLITRDDAGNVIPLSQRFNARKNDVRYRFIGEKGAANLDKAEEATTRLDNLSVAREMETAGKDAKAIKMATGWERGADGKWRYETDDNLDGVEFKTQDELEEEYYADKKAADKAQRKYSDVYQFPELYYRASKKNTAEENERLRRKRTEAQKYLKELIADYNRLEDIARKSWQRANDGIQGVPLSDVLGENHPLLIAYPEMNEITVDFYPSGRYIGSDGSNGHYNHRLRSMFISTDGTREKMRSTLSHELQHAVQDIEGFAPGGNPVVGAIIADRLDKLTDVQRKFIDSIRLYNEFKSQGTLRDDYTVSEYVKGLGSDEFGEDFFKDISVMTDEEIQREYERLSEMGKRERMTAMEAYRSLSGEVEARNVQSRLNMTPEERRNSLAAETEDVAREEQIFLNDALGVSAALAEPAAASLQAKRQAALDAGVALGVEVVIEEASGKGRRSAKDRALGWFDAKTGAVHVNPANHADVADVQRTVLHEAVGHMGMRRLLDKKAPGTFDAFLDRVHASMPAEARAYFMDYARKTQAGRSLSEAELSRIAADEYVAALAEVGGDPNVWQRVVAEVRNLLRALGFDLDLSEADIRALLYESKYNLESAAYYAEREMMRREQKEFRDEANLSNRLDEDEREMAEERMRAQGAESAEIERKAKADGTWLKAPNGKPTNLTPEQWIQVRTKAFKDWFGEWELPTKTVNIVNAIADHGFKNFDAAKQWAEKNIVRTLNNEETGGKGEIRISNTAVGKFLSQSSVEKSESKDVHLSVLKVLPDVIRESVDVEQHPDYKKDNDGVRSKENGVNEDVTIHRLYGSVGIDGNTYRVKITLKEDTRNSKLPKGTYSYEATKIELLAGTLGKPDGDAPSTNNSISVAKLLQGVKKSNSNEEILNASKVVDENGEPLVVYHGTRHSGFSVFDDTEGDKQSDAPEGTSWFSSNYNVARSYSGTYDNAAYELEEDEERGEPGNFACFLNIRNPNVENFEGANWQGEAWGKFRIEVNDGDGNFAETVYTEDWKSLFDSKEDAERYAEEHGIENYEIKANPWIGYSTNEVARMAKEDGADGVVVENVIDYGGYFEDEESTVYVTFSPTQIKSATDNVGTFDAENPDIRYRMRNAGTAYDPRLGVISIDADRGGRYDKWSRQGMYRRASAVARYLLDDSMPLRHLMTHIRRSAGGVVGSATDLWRQKTMTVSRARFRIDEYNRKIGEPLMESVRDIYRATKDKAAGYLGKLAPEKKNKTYYIDLYLMAKHIPERNAWMAANRDSGRSDYAGAEGFEAKTGMTPEEYVKRFERMIADAGMDGRLNDMWRLINESTDFSLRQRVNDGLMGKDKYDEIMGRGWQYYVPLRSWDEKNSQSGDFADMEYPRQVDSMNDTFTNNVIGAEGRSSLADSPLAYIFRDAETSVTLGETNRYRQAVARLRDDNKNLTYIFGTPDFLKGKETEREEQSHFVTYYENGKRKQVGFVNPMLAAAVRGDRERKRRHWMRPMQVLTRIQSALNTSLNPAFALTNAARDIQFGIYSRFVESANPVEGFAASVMFIYELLRNLPAAVQASTKGGGIDGTGRNAQLIRAWRENGGETGWHTLNDLRETKDKLYKGITNGKVKNGTKEVLSAIPATFRVLTEISENAVRLAAFSDAKRRGMSDQGAASYSKEITTNFNRHSQFAQDIGPLYMFLNAQTQGIYRFLTLTKENPGNTALAAIGMAAAGLFMSIGEALKSGGDDDDEKGDFLDRNEFLRFNNFIMGNFILPVAHNARMFFGIGAAAGDYIMGHSNENQLAYNLMQITGRELLPSVGNVSDWLGYDWKSRGIEFDPKAFASGVFPSAFTPVVEAYTNRNFMGSPIYYEESVFRPYAPRVARSRKDVNPLLLKFTEWRAAMDGYDPDVNKKTGFRVDEMRTIRGRFDWNASALEHILTSYAGGTGKFLNDTYKMVTKWEDGEEVKPGDVPILKSFVRPIDPDAALYRTYNRLRDQKDLWEKVLNERFENISAVEKAAEKRHMSVEDYVEMQRSMARSGLREFDKYEDAIKKLAEAQAKGGDKAEEVQTIRKRVMRMANKIENSALRERNAPQADRKALLEATREALRGADEGEKKRMIDAFWDILLRRDRTEKAAK